MCSISWYLTGDVALPAADGFAAGETLGGAALEVVLGAVVGA
jgi:hypothetical protein